MLSCKHVSEEILKRSFEEVKTSLFNGEVLRNLIYHLNYILTFYIINSYYCNFLLIRNEARTVEMSSISVAQLEYEKLNLVMQPKASRRTAAEQMGSPREFCYQVLCSNPVLAGVTLLDPITLGNLVPIGNSQ
jgi:hypothetical protein